MYLNIPLVHRVMSIIVPVPLPTKVGEEPLLQMMSPCWKMSSSIMSPLELESKDPPHRTVCIGIHGDENVTVTPVLKKLDKLKRNMVNGNVTIDRKPQKASSPVPI